MDRSTRHIPSLQAWTTPGWTGTCLPERHRPASYDAVTDKEALESFKLLSETEGIIPALESAHAIAYAKKYAEKEENKGKTIVINLSGRGDKDMDLVAREMGCGNMSHIESYQEMFQRVKDKGEGAFIPFVVVGDPDFETSLEMVKTYVDNGADALELGFPFSDPIADGPTVQAADIRSLNSGMTTRRGFEFIKCIREFTNIPLGLLIYYNLIYKMGADEFYKAAKESGLNGILAADLPPEEAEILLDTADKYGLDQIFMAAQTTSNERLEK